MYRRVFALFLLLFSSCQTMPDQPTYPADRPVVPLNGDQIIALQPGQIFNYNFVLDNRTNGVRAEGTIRQIATRYQDTKIQDAVAAVYDASSQNRTQNGNQLPPVAFSSSSIFVNDSEGYPSLIVARSNNGVTKYVNTPVEGYSAAPLGGVIRIGDGFTAGPVQFSDGSTQTCNYVVAGTEIVDTPLARFETYRIESSCTFNEPGKVTVSNYVSWVHPSIGEVKFESMSQDPVGFVVFTGELVSTNVPF